MYSLGRKEYGRLGLGEDVEEKMEPTRVAKLNGKKCIHVDAGTAVSFAVTEGGECWQPLYHHKIHVQCTA